MGRLKVHNTASLTMSRCVARVRADMRLQAWLVVAVVSVSGCDSGTTGAPDLDATAKRDLAATESRIAGGTDGTDAAPPPVEDGRWQWRLTFTPDGRTAYYSVSEGWFPRTRTASIVRVELSAGDGWTAPETASFSDQYSDMDPFITPDGRRLYFSSNRPVNGIPREAFDIWYVEREGDRWGEPVHLGDTVNSDQDELYASVALDGTLYFASGPAAPSPGHSWNIYRSVPARGGFAPREILPGVNSDVPASAESPAADWDFNPEISPDGRTLFFTSLRPGGHGFGDLYMSVQDGGDWSPPRNLGPGINTADDEYHPTLSRDGRTLYFVRARFTPEVVPGRFHSIPVGEIEAAPPEE